MTIEPLSEAELQLHHRSQWRYRTPVRCPTCDGDTASRYGYYGCDPMFHLAAAWTHVALAMAVRRQARWWDSMEPSLEAVWADHRRRNDHDAARGIASWSFVVPQGEVAPGDHVLFVAHESERRQNFYGYDVNEVRICGVPCLLRGAHGLEGSCADSLTRRAPVAYVVARPAYRANSEGARAHHRQVLELNMRRFWHEVADDSTLQAVVEQRRQEIAARYPMLNVTSEHALRSLVLKGAEAVRNQKGKQ